MPSTRMQRRPGPLSSMFPFSRELDQLQANVRRMFDNPFAAGFPSAIPQPLAWTPPVEIAESRTELTLTMELPGMDMQNVHVTIDGDVLTISGEKTEERKEEAAEKQYYLFERNYGAFERSFTLTNTIDAAKIDAEFDKGVLTIRLPKTEAAAARGREIPIGKKK